MKTNTARARMLEGKPAVGVIAGLGSAVAAGILAGAGFDFVMVDNQHGDWDDDRTLTAFRSINATPAIPMARVRWNDFSAIGRLLDRGALGIGVPMVNSVAEARAAAFAARFPPRGGRSQGIGIYNGYGSDHDACIDDELYLAVQIETVEAAEQAYEILSVEGVDGCWIGPADLSHSMGVDLASQAGRQAHEALILRVRDACLKAGKIPGIHAVSPADARRWLDHGFLFVTMGTDLALLSGAARDCLQDLGR